MQPPSALLQFPSIFPTVSRSLAWLLCFVGATSAIGQNNRPSPAVAVRLEPTVTLTSNAPYFASRNFLRSGAEVDFSVRVEPADATGTSTFWIDGVAVQTASLSTQVNGEYVAVGDSITYAAYIADPAERYQAIVGKDLGLAVTTIGSPGYTACDTMLLNIVPTNVGLAENTNPLYSLMIGANEALVYGIGPNESLFNLCHMATLTWLGLPRSSKLLIGDRGVGVQSGNWTAAIAFGHGTLNALTSANGSGTVRFDVATEGDAAYLWYLMQANQPGSFTVSVDGGAQSGATSTLFPSAIRDTIPGSYGLLRIPVAPGRHTIDVNALSGTVGLLGMGAAPSASTTLPTVLATDVPANQTPELDAAVAAYTADIQSNIAVLRADGLDIRFAPTQKFMTAIPAEMMDARHPNALGLAELAKALEAAIQPTEPASGHVAAATAVFSTSAISIGGHQIEVTYSGDTRYAPASATIIPFVVYDSTSSISFTAGGSVYSAQTPITLTGTVGGTNPSGYINFFETDGGSQIQLGGNWMNRVLPGASQVTLPSLPIGQHTLFAQYLGDVSYSGSTSKPLVVMVSPIATTTSLASPATRYFAGSGVELTASVHPASSTGTVTFLDGPTSLGQSTMVSGTATFTASSLAPGLHAITAHFSGSSTQSASQSPELGIEIDPNPTVTTLKAAPSSGVYGTLVGLVTGISPASATGSVVLEDSFVPLGQTTAITQVAGPLSVAAGYAYWSTNSLAPGLHTFTATYSGDDNDLPSFSGPVVVPIDRVSASIALSTTPAIAAVGSPIAVTAKVTPSTASGSVTFTDSISGALAQVTLRSGTATFDMISLSPGQHTITATYSGDALRTATSSASTTVSVTQIASGVAIAPLPPTIFAGNRVSLSATISPATATGSVTFRDATQGVLGQSAVANGTAIVSLAAVPTGSYVMTAAYSGDTNDAPAISAPVNMQVVLNPIAVTFAASPSATVPGTPITLRASLSSTTATGSVTFYDGPTQFGMSPVSNGTATLNVASLAAGVHTLHATYGGDALYAASSSGATMETITSSPTSTTMTLAQSTVQAGVAIVGNIRIATTKTTPNGRVSLRSGNVVLASAAVANGTSGSGYATLSFNSASLGLGTFPLTAWYSGDPSDEPSDTSVSPVSVTVQAVASTSTLSLSAAQIPVQGSVTLTVTVRSATGGSVPTGSVTFVSNGRPIATSAVTAGGTAIYTVLATSTGTLTLTAQFRATGIFAESAADVQTVTVTAPLAAAISPATLQAKPGSSQSTALLITPLSGYTGAIQATCQTSAKFLSCAMTSPTSIADATPIRVPVQISVARTLSSLREPPTVNAAGLSAFLALLAPCLIRRRSRRVAGKVFVALAACIYCVGCGTGGNFNSVPPGDQNVTLTVTAAGVSVSSRLTVTVAE